MEKDKKKIIAGAAILGGAALAYVLTRKKEIPPPPTYTCPYCGETFATLEELLAHIQAEHPQEPPVVDYGRIWGYIKDSATSDRIAGAKVYVDDVLDCISDTSGAYGTNYYLFGSHTLSVIANNYETFTSTVDIQAESAKLEILLTKLPVVPTDWTEGITVREIEVSPSIVYLGETVQIKVYIDYPFPLPALPMTIHGTVSVDGTELTEDWVMEEQYGTVLQLEYVTTALGNFTVTAQDKSAGFTVLESIVATYYSPFGGVRMPLCTDIMIPNVPAFDHTDYGYPLWPGGDLIWSEYFGTDPYYNAPISEFRLLDQTLTEIVAQLPQGQPIAWTPSDAVMMNWVTNYATGRGIPISRLLVAATGYSCKEYWESKDELATMIAGHGTMTYPVSEWTSIFGKTCPTCNGTGLVWSDRRHRYDTCGTCGGDGIIVRVNLTRGIRDWVKPFDYYVQYYNYTYTTRIRCPICDDVFTTGTYDDSPGQEGRLNAARFLINHIETKHPSHPLTEPAWF